MQLNGISNSVLPVVDTPVQASLKGARREQADPAAAKKVAREFESMFVAMMLKSMRETVGKETLTGGGRGEETFRSLLDQEYAAAATRSGGIGLAQTIERELMRSNAAPAPRKGADHAD
ncbi:MAG: rod-binding protein [Geobacteraceae bacterium GWC2_58_44]|nr:MAG: rod-binding protein [Geobacteraceae bacterium GWC2_58_44]